MREEKINIVIVDSGVDSSHTQFAGISVKGFTFHSGVLSEDFHDEYGHGTAIFNIIKCVAAFANIINIKIPDIEKSACEEDLIHVLQYIKTELKCDILNLSLGMNICNQYLNRKGMNVLFK